MEYIKFDIEKAKEVLPCGAPRYFIRIYSAINHKIETVFNIQFIWIPLLSDGRRFNVRVDFRSILSEYEDGEFDMAHFDADGFCSEDQSLKLVLIERKIGEKS